MGIWIFDIEANGLLEEKDGQPPADKIHCLVLSMLSSDDYKIFYEKDIPLFRKEIKNLKVVAGHNIFGYDLKLLNKLYGITYGYSKWDGHRCKFVDTFMMSQYLWPDRPAPKGMRGSHGLEAWGKRNGVWKPEVEDWHNLPLEVYVNRCIEDVKNNKLTYNELLEEHKRYV